jgi:hypothetical protein
LSDTGQRDVLIDERNGFDLPFLIEVEHQLCFDFGEPIEVFFKGHIEVVVFIIVAIVAYVLSALGVVVFFLLFVAFLVIVVAKLFLLVSNIELQIVSVRIGHFEWD